MGGGGVKALNAFRGHQGFNMQMEATKEGADNTGDVKGLGHWMCHLSHSICFDGTGSTEVVPMTLSGATGNQQGVITEVMMDTKLTQTSNIRKAVSSGEKHPGLLTLPQWLHNLLGTVSQ